MKGCDKSINNLIVDKFIDFKYSFLPLIVTLIFGISSKITRSVAKFRISGYRL